MQPKVTSPLCGCTALRPTSGPYVIRSGGTMKPKADLAGQIEPDGNLLLLSRTGVALGQALQHPAVDEMAEQVRFGGLRNVLQVIEFTPAQGIDHKLAILLEERQIHNLLLWLRLFFFGDGRSRAFSSRSTASST